MKRPHIRNALYCSAVFVLAVILLGHVAQGAARTAGGQGDQIFADGFELPANVCNPANPDANGDGLIDSACIEAFVPPDPAAVAPPLDPTVITDFSDANDFIFDGPNPIQRGVDPAVIQPYRMAVLRGRVMDAGQNPLPGVLVRVLNHPEYGYSYTRADGYYDLAVNGGGEITVDYQRQGYLHVQRREITPWRDWGWFPQTTMIALDTVATDITLNGSTSLQVHRASVVSDNAGVRQATVMFQPGTTAELVLPDGSHQTLPQMRFRATEYTVGPNGPSRMPAPLPANIGYTYAVELSADEAVTASARSVEFNKPVVLYFENHLGFPVGMHVPLGSYDFRMGSWLPAPDGRVIKLIGVTGGLAELDIDGTGQPAGPAELSALGITQAERIKLAETYSVGETLWRSAITHLTPWDCNFPYEPTPDAEPPQPPPDQPDQSDPPDVPPDDSPPKPDATTDDDPEPCNTSGSIIDCSNSRLGEVVPVSGTPYSLVYQSTRLPGSQSGDYRVRVPVTGPQVPPGVKRMTVDVDFAGMRHSTVIDPPAAANYYENFDWDGKDAYGRAWQGPVKAHITVGYVYDLVYQVPGSQSNVNWGVFSGFPIIGNRSSREMTLYQDWEANASTALAHLFTGTWDAMGQGLGGWTLSSHHVFDPTSRTLYMGDGRRRPIGNIGANGIVQVHAYRDGIDPNPLEFGYNSAWRLGTGGEVFTLYPGWADCGGECGPGPFVQRLTIQDPQNPSMSTVLENCQADPEDPGICAAGSAPLWRNAGDLAVANDGSVILQSNATVIYGLEEQPEPVDMKLYRVIPARSEAQVLVDLSDSGVDCDRFSSAPEVLDTRVYFACVRDSDGAGLIFTAWPDGSVTRLVGGGTQLGTGVAALDIALGEVTQILPAADGSVYFYEPEHSEIRRVGTDGIVRVVAGNGNYAFSEDGSVAANSSITAVVSMALSRDQTLLFAEHGRIREVAKNGQLHTLVGGGNAYLDNTSAKGVVAGQFDVRPYTLQVAPDGSVVFDSYGNLLFSWSGSTFRFDDVAGDFKFPSRDGSQVFVFDRQGRHLRTLNAVTGATQLSFQYNNEGYLTEIVDGDGNATTIERNAGGTATAIVSPWGMRTQLGYQGQGLLTSASAPDGRQWDMSYKPGNLGLLQSFTTPRGYAATFVWGLEGRLQRDSNAEGGFKALQHNRSASWDLNSGYVSTAMGRQRKVHVRRTQDGYVRRWIQNPDGRSTTTATDRSYRVQSWRNFSVSVDSVYASDPRFGPEAAFVGDATIRQSNYMPPLKYRAVHTAVPTVPDAGLGQIDLGESVTINEREYTRLYDSATRTWVQRSPAGREASTRIDLQSRPLKRTISGLADIDYTYDSYGRMRSVVAGTGADQRTWTFGYDSNGYLASVEDPLGRQTLLTRDAAGRTTEQTLPGGRTIHMDWDANSNLVGLTPPDREPHVFSYNKVDRLTGYTPPALAGTSTPTAYADNLDSQLQQITDADNRVAQFQFDATRTQPQALSIPSETRSLSYSAGRLTDIASNNGIGTHFQWLGALPDGASWSGPITGSVSLTYDEHNGQSNFWVAQRTVADSTGPVRDIHYSYDADGLPTQINAAMAGAPSPVATMDLTHDPDNGLLTGTHLAAVDDTWSYNSFAEPIGYSVTVNGNATYDTSFTRDKLGRITQRQTTLQGQSHSFGYTYDTAGRLVSVARDGVGVGVWTWDSNGNRLSATVNGVNVNCNYDAQDRLTGCGDVSYGWNASGQLTQRVDTSTSTQTDYAYGMLGNLRTVDLPNGTHIEYLVDGINRRIGKKVNGTLVKGFLYQDGLHPIAELAGDGSIKSLFVYADRPNVPSYMLKDGHVYRIISDQLGSPRLVIDVADGSIAQRMDYDAWGNVLEDTQPGFQPFGFAGGLYDPDTGLVRFGARDYDPETGRWTAKDPIGFAGGSTNIFEYVNGDPINHFDPDGRQFGWASKVWKALHFGGESASAYSSSNDAIDYAQLSANLNSATFNIGRRDYEQWRQIHLHIPDPRGSLIDWRKVDWDKYDQGSFEKTIQCMMNPDKCSEKLCK